LAGPPARASSSIERARWTVHLPCHVGASSHAWRKYEELQANPTGELLPSAANGVNGEQWKRLADEGDLRGVSTDTTLK